MAIQKQEFYEGAALMRLATAAQSIHLEFDHPYYIADNRLVLYIKYTTKARTPWGFTFSAAELAGLLRKARTTPVVIGLVCGSDGIVALELRAILALLTTRKVGFHISCARDHRKFYCVSGPAGSLASAIAPSEWQNLLSRPIS